MFGELRVGLVLEDESRFSRPDSPRREGNIVYVTSEKSYISHPKDLMVEGILRLSSQEMKRFEEASTAAINLMTGPGGGQVGKLAGGVAGAIGWQITFLLDYWVDSKTDSGAVARDAYTPVPIVTLGAKMPDKSPIYTGPVIYREN